MGLYQLVPVPFRFLSAGVLPGYPSIHFMSQATHMISVIDRRRISLSGSKVRTEKILKKKGVRIKAKSQPTSSIALHVAESLVLMLLIP
jgi:hypothetical protein